MRSSIRSGTTGHARDIHAAIVGDSEQHGLAAKPALRFREVDSEGDRADGGDIGGGGGVRGVDDPAAVRVRHELPDPEVPAGAEQDHGDGVDRGGGACAARAAELAADAAAGLGDGGGGGGAERVVVADRGGAGGVRPERHVRGGVEWVLVEGLSESVGIRSPLACICRYAMVCSQSVNFLSPFFRCCPPWNACAMLRHVRDARGTCSRTGDVEHKEFSAAYE